MTFLRRPEDVLKASVSAGRVTSYNFLTMSYEKDKDDKAVCYDNEVMIKNWGNLGQSGTPGQSKVFHFSSIIYLNQQHTFLGLGQYFVHTLSAYVHNGGHNNSQYKKKIK